MSAHGKLLAYINTYASKLSRDHTASFWGWLAGVAECNLTHVVVPCPNNDNDNDEAIANASDKDAHVEEANEQCAHEASSSPSCAEDSGGEAATEKEYEVEAILDQTPDGKLFKIKWKGYEEEEATTWEPLIHIENTTAYVEYARRIKHKRGGGSRQRIDMQQSRKHPRTSATVFHPRASARAGTEKLYRSSTGKLVEFLQADDTRMWRTTSLGRDLWDRSINPALQFGQNREDKTYQFATTVLFQKGSSGAAASSHVSKVLIPHRSPVALQVVVVRQVTREKGVCGLCHATHALGVKMHLTNEDHDTTTTLVCGAQCAERLEACTRLLRWVHDTRKEWDRMCLDKNTDDTVCAEFLHDAILACGKAQANVMRVLRMDAKPTTAMQRDRASDRKEAEELDSAIDLVTSEDEDEDDDGVNQKGRTDDEDEDYVNSDEDEDYAAASNTCDTEDA
jgi:hypothetical protein